MPQFDESVNVEKEKKTSDSYIDVLQDFKNLGQHLAIIL